MAKALQRILEPLFECTEDLVVFVHKPGRLELVFADADCDLIRSALEGADDEPPASIILRVILDGLPEQLRESGEGFGEWPAYLRRLADQMEDKVMDTTAKVATVRAVIDTLVEECHATAKANGFWEGQDPRAAGPTKIALMHSELSEALELMRQGDFHGDLAEEFADVLIRVFDYCGAAEIDLGRAVIDKMERNRHRTYRHGKIF